MDDLINSINGNTTSNDPPNTSRPNNRHRNPSNQPRNNTRRSNTNRPNTNPESLLGTLTLAEFATIDPHSSEQNSEQPPDSDNDLNLLPTPPSVNDVSEMRALTNQMADTFMRKNTTDAYKYRMLEFRGFCQAVYFMEPLVKRFTITGHKFPSD